MRGLSRNPAIPAGLLHRLIEEHRPEIRHSLGARRVWTDDQVEVLLRHPDVEVRVMLTEAWHLSFVQRAALIDDPSRSVLAGLWTEPDFFSWGWRDKPQPLLTDDAYERLVRRDPKVAAACVPDSHWLTEEQKQRFLELAGYPPTSRPAPGSPPPTRLAPGSPPTSRPVTAEPPDDLTRAEAEAMVADPADRHAVAGDPRLPADIVARLATDPSDEVRLTVSMRPEFTEEQRAAIDYHVGPRTRVRPARWAYETRDPDEQRRCAMSSHIGLRRSVACNTHLDPALIAMLAGDDDFAVRLLLCEAQENLPADLIIDTYVEAEVLSAGRLLNHPALDWRGQATRLAAHPHPKARALVSFDPDAPPSLIERLSHDEHPAVRRGVAADGRLSPARALALYADPAVTERAAAGPHLPIELMHEILSDAATLAEQDAADARQQTVHLGF